MSEFEGVRDLIFVSNSIFSPFFLVAFLTGKRNLIDMKNQFFYLSV